MRLLTFLLVWCMLLAGGSNLLAQSNHVYEDSSILYPQENAPVEEVEVVAAPMQDDSYDEEASEAVITDTNLISNRLFLSPDSINALRRDRQFGYAKNLDSLLKAMQAKLSCMTFSRLSRFLA